jgi:hypothetical protein
VMNPVSSTGCYPPGVQKIRDRQIKGSANWGIGGNQRPCSGVFEIVMHPLEHLLRSSPRSRRTEIPDNNYLSEEGALSPPAHHRRVLLVAVAVILMVAAAVWITGQSSSDAAKVGLGASIRNSHNHLRVQALDAVGAMTGSLVLPLTGTVQAEGLHFDTQDYSLAAGGASTSRGPEASASVPDDRFSAASNGGSSGGAGPDQSVDVPPGTSQTMHRLSTHVSPDGIIVSTFYAADPSAPEPLPFASPPTVSSPARSHTGASASGTSASVAPPSCASPSCLSAPGVPVGVSRPPSTSCSSTGELTLELSDTRAVATFTEPFYGGFNTPLIDVEIGELGVTEGSPATWVEAQVGAGARRVLVQFADGAVDSASPARGVAVLASLGDAATTLGKASHAFLEVLAAGGRLLARYSIGVAAPSPSVPLPPALPSTSVTQPPPTGSAMKGVTTALTTALSCSEPPVLQSQAVAGGGAFEELGGAGSSGMSPGDRIVVDKVVFSSSTSAAVRFHVYSPGQSDPQNLYADAALVHGAWLVSLDSVAPGLQVAPANQDGDVSVAPGGPLFVHIAGRGVAIAVYRAQRSSPAGNGCAGESCTGSPSATCAPTGGIVEEVTTPGAVGIESAPLFGNYSAPVIGIGLSIVGEAEGAPATVVGVEVGPSVRAVAVHSVTGTQSFTPVAGEVDAVLDGAPSAAFGAAGGSVVALDASGGVVASVPLRVDSTEPAPASSLPTSLPPTGTSPSDPTAATAAIDQAFQTVFSCANSPLVRSGEIQDNGMFANPLEQPYLGPYTSLVESVYATVSQVVFVTPTLADVSYTIAFHDSTLTFEMIGSAVVADGTWRVSYATLCAAVALGGASCSS